MIYIYITIVFIFGLLFGSFANVVILRFPKGISIVKPRSFCPQCMAAIPWYLNIPVLSYILLGGKCINCKSPISFRYPLVELLTAVITLSWFLKFGMTITALIYFFCGLLLIIASGIDYDYKVLPPQFTYSLILIGLAASPFNEFLTGSIFESLAGAVAGAALIYIIRFFGTKIFKKEAMGLGDMKLMAGIGALTGPVGVLWTLFIGSIFGSIVGVGMRIFGKVGKLQEIPFGPYLAAGMVIYVNFSGWLKSLLI